MAHIVITGITGFVGGALARALHGAGHTLTGLARPTADRSPLRDLPIQWHQGDVTDPQSLPGLFEGAEWLVHAAGMLGQAGVPEETYHQLHVTGTRHILDAATAAGSLGRILYVSSPGVLGPINEPAAAAETHPLAPSNPYERSKAAAESLACQYAADGLPVVIARPEFIYGPGDLHVLGLFQAVRRGLFFYIGDGAATCHPTYIADAVNGMLLCLQNGRPGEIYHITGPRPVTFRQLGETIAATLSARPPWLRLPRGLAMSGAAILEKLGPLTGITPPLSRTGVAFFSENRRFSWEKARQELGYMPQFELQAGVAATVRWYRAHNHLPPAREKSAV